MLVYVSLAWDELLLALTEPACGGLSSLLGAHATVLPFIPQVEAGMSSSLKKTRLSGSWSLAATVSDSSATVVGLRSASMRPMLRRWMKAQG